MATKPPVVFLDPTEFPLVAKVPSAELKQYIMLYVPTPPGPKACRRVLDAYFARFGDTFADYAATSAHIGRTPWNYQAKQHFLQQELPRLRQQEIWGYSFWDGKNQESQFLMFHGYPPVSESWMSSFFRFEFSWQLEPEILREFTQELLGIVTCLSGCAGYTFVGLPHGQGASESWNQLCAMIDGFNKSKAEKKRIRPSPSATRYKGKALSTDQKKLRNQYADGIEVFKEVFTELELSNPSEADKKFNTECLKKAYKEGAITKSEMSPDHVHDAGLGGAIAGTAAQKNLSWSGKKLNRRLGVCMRGYKPEIHGKCVANKNCKCAS